MLRVAVPNKGSLAEPASVMLRDSGYRQRSDSRDLSMLDEDNGVRFFYLRPKDIATYVADGSLHLGITGRDLIQESGASVRQRLRLGFGRSKFRYAAPKHKNWDLKDLEGKRIATSYPQLVRSNLALQRIRDARVIRLDGAVEISVALGVADAIADVVGSGRTLEQHNLVVIGDPILESQAVLVERVPRSGKDPDPNDVEAEKSRFIERLRGVLYARRYLMLDYDCPEEIQDRAVHLTPGLESPTISKLRKQGWVAVRAMVKRHEVNLVMDQLAELGCRGVLTSEILSCRAVGPGNGDAEGDGDGDGDRRDRH